MNYVLDITKDKTKEPETFAFIKIMEQHESSLLGFN